MTFAATLAARKAHAGEPRFTTRIETWAARRVAIVTPRVSSEAASLPVLLLLHGLGETNDADAGARAWPERYGLVSCLERLAQPPVRATQKRADLPADYAARVNGELADRALPPFAVVCPHMPNLQTPDAARGYLPFLRELLAALPAPLDTSRVTLGGCSLGGFVSLECFLAAPDRFRGWAGVQNAIGVAGAPRYAERLAATKSRTFFVATSTEDPYRAANEKLAAEIVARGVRVTSHTFPGPHDQPWLREVGTLALLHWFGRCV